MNISTDNFVTRLKCYGKNDLNICSMPSDKFHEKGKPYIECFDYFKENNYGFSKENKEQFIIEKTYVNENVTDVHELYILGLECLLKKCRPEVSIENKNKEINFYDGIVSNLKQEAKHLNDRLTKFRNNNEMNGYIATLKSLRETLDLIKKYDWQLMYSEYGVENTKEIMRIDDSIDDVIDIALANNKTRNEIRDEIDYLIRKKDNYITEIAVWEQNHDGQIRNHKVWKTDIPYKKHNCDNIIFNEEVKHINNLSNIEKDMFEYNKKVNDILKKMD